MPGLCLIALLGNVAGFCYSRSFMDDNNNENREYRIGMGAQLREKTSLLTLTMLVLYILVVDNSTTLRYSKLLFK